MQHGDPRSWVGTCDGCWKHVQFTEDHHCGPDELLYCAPCAACRNVEPNTKAISDEAEEARKAAIYSK